MYFNLCIHDTFKLVFAPCQVYIHVYQFIFIYVIKNKKYFLQISYNFSLIIYHLSYQLLVNDYTKDFNENRLSLICLSTFQWSYKQPTYTTVYVIHIASQPTSHWACKHPWLILQTSFHQFSQEWSYKHPFANSTQGANPGFEVRGGAILGRGSGSRL